MGWSPPLGKGYIREPTDIIVCAYTIRPWMVSEATACYTVGLVSQLHVSLL